jgi:hypothetical protein
MRTEESIDEKILCGSLVAIDWLGEGKPPLTGSVDGNWRESRGDDARSQGIFEGWIPDPKHTKG